MDFQVPTGENLTFGDENFIKFEEAGVREAQNAAFVLVAGGLGERLGYNGIKVNILCPLERKEIWMTWYYKSVSSSSVISEIVFVPYILLYNLVAGRSFIQ